MKCRDCCNWVAPPMTKYATLYPLAGKCTSGNVLYGDEASKAYVDDGTTYPEFHCGPDFGCVHFEAK